MALDGINDITKTGDLEVAQALKSTFGFNLGFAIEGRVGEEDVFENMDQIRTDVIGVLVEMRKGKESIDSKTEAGRQRIEEIKDISTSEVNNLLNNEALIRIAEGYEVYRQQVIKGFGIKSSTADFNI